jgi:ribosome-binding factor A
VVNTEIKRAVRVAGRVREELAAQLRGMRDPRLSEVVVTTVEMTDDLQLARIYVRHQVTTVDERERRALLKALSNAGGRLRRDVAKAVSLRYAPTLKFYYDEGPEKRERVEELLREIELERQDRED